MARAPVGIRRGPRLPRPAEAALDRGAGNHDISPFRLIQRFLRPFTRYRRAIAAETEPCFEDAEIGIVCLNTVRRWAPEPDWSHGVIRRSQIVRAEARLSAMPDHLFKIVVGHHPSCRPPGTRKPGWSGGPIGPWPRSAAAGSA